MDKLKSISLGIAAVSFIVCFALIGLFIDGRIYPFDPDHTLGVIFGAGIISIISTITHIYFRLSPYREWPPCNDNTKKIM